MLGAEKTKIIKFFRNNFDQVILEERDSLDTNVDRGEILYIIGFDGKGENHHIIAAIMYVSCVKGSYINWFAVSPLTYDSTRFGKHLNNQHFCYMALELFICKWFSYKLCRKATVVIYTFKPT